MTKYILIIFLLLTGMTDAPYVANRSPSDTPQTIAQRSRMVEKQIRGRGIRDHRVLEAMGRIPRHLFVDPELKGRAYGDHPLPIGEGQTISQPYVVALMTEALDLDSEDKVLEIGTGSGYQAAVLAEIVGEVFTIEIKERLVKKAGLVLNSLGYDNVKTRYGDGYYGWEEHAPFDAIIITASANHIPPPLISQLRDGGKLIIPLGSTHYYQVLTLLTKNKGDLDVQQMGDVLFVPMTGKALSR